MPRVGVAVRQQDDAAACALQGGGQFGGQFAAALPAAAQVGAAAGAQGADGGDGGAPAGGVGGAAGGVGDDVVGERDHRDAVAGRQRFDDADRGALRRLERTALHAAGGVDHDRHVQRRTGRRRRSAHGERLELDQEVARAAGGVHETVVGEDAALQGVHSGDHLRSSPRYGAGDLVKRSRVDPGRGRAWPRGRRRR